MMNLLLRYYEWKDDRYYRAWIIPLCGVALLAGRHAPGCGTATALLALPWALAAVLDLASDAVWLYREHQRRASRIRSSA